MAQKILKNRQTSTKTGEAELGPVNSKFPKPFHTTMTLCGPKPRIETQRQG